MTAGQNASLILGMGLSGIAVARYLSGLGRSVVAYDDCWTAEKEDALKGLQDVAILKAPLAAESLGHIAKVFISPGVPLTHPGVRLARQLKLPVVGELEEACRLIQKPVVAVTGTNGKSTTVKLIWEILKASGLHAALGGNIGTPMLDLVSGDPWDIYVVEVSSFQLETITAFHPKISVLLNITPDHLDRYPSMAAYIAAKARIIENQAANDVFIYNAEDIACAHLAARARAQVFALSLVNPQEQGAWVEREVMKFRLRDVALDMPLTAASLQGLHNQENMLAAGLAALAAGVQPATVREVFAHFQGLPHRLCPVATVRGVTFYNDSKATNVGAVVMSLASLAAPVVWIAGGRDKASDLLPLKGLVAGKVSQAVFLGEAKVKFADFFCDIVPVQLANSLEEAVALAYAHRGKAKTVVFAPGCASYDMFRNFAERGERFVQAVGQFKGTAKQTIET